MQRRQRTANHVAPVVPHLWLRSTGNLGPLGATIQSAPTDRVLSPIREILGCGTQCPATVVDRTCVDRSACVRIEVSARGGLWTGPWTGLPWASTGGASRMVEAAGIVPTSPPQSWRDRGKRRDSFPDASRRVGRCFAETSVPSPRWHQLAADTTIAGCENRLRCEEPGWPASAPARCPR